MPCCFQPSIHPSIHPSGKRLLLALLKPVASNCLPQILHAGLFFLIWGLYWTVCIFHAYLLQQFPATAKGKKQLPASANAAPYTFPSYQGTRWQLVEPVAKAVLGLYGVTWAFHHQLACLGIRSGDCWCAQPLNALRHILHVCNCFSSCCQQQKPAARCHTPQQQHQASFVAASSGLAYCAPLTHCSQCGWR